jgi:hypothetical protein
MTLLLGVSFFVASKVIIPSDSQIDNRGSKSVGTLEALLKTGVIMSVPRLLNAFFPLVKAIPDEDSVDYEVVRKYIKNPFDLTERGSNYMKDVFGASDMEAFIATMAKFWPDLRKLLLSKISFFFS